MDVIAGKKAIIQNPDFSSQMSSKFSLVTSLYLSFDFGMFFSCFSSSPKY